MVIRILISNLLRGAILAVGLVGFMIWVDALWVGWRAAPPLEWPERGDLALRSGAFLALPVLVTVILHWSASLLLRAIPTASGGVRPRRRACRDLTLLVAPVMAGWAIFIMVLARSGYKDDWWWKALLWGVLAGWIASWSIGRLGGGTARKEPRALGFGITAAVLAAAWIPIGILSTAEWAAGGRGSWQQIHAADPDQPFNFVLVIVDTLRADHLGAYGYERATSPFMDRNAASGVLFRDVVSPSSWTLPAVASVLTSTYPGRHGADRLGTRFPREADDLASRLREAGYRTASFNTNPWLRRVFGFDDGFDDYYDQSRLSLRREMAGVRLKNLVLRKLNKIRDDPERLPRAPEVTSRAERWLRENGAGPFFLYLHYMDVHAPYLPVEPYRGRFCRGHRFDLPDHLLEHRFRHLKLTGDMEALEHVIDRYDEEILATDDSFGRLMRSLEGIGLSERTVVILTSDHGEEFYDHGGTRHSRTLYQEVVRVPLIVILPGGGRSPGRSVQARVSTLDVYPTILEMAGLPVPAHVAGESLVPYLTPGPEEVRPASRDGEGEFGEGDAIPRAVGSQLFSKGRVWSTLFLGGEKIIRGRAPAGDSESGDTVELYHLDGDPRERMNVANLEPALADGLLSLLEGLEQSWGVPAADRPEGREEIDPETLEQLEALGYVH
jgi:arylsulfatase